MGKEMIIKVLEDDGVEMSDMGSYYRGKCPFHPDKIPSFVVYKNTYKYHCFGCQERGDVIDYIRKTRELSFSGAVKYLGLNYTSRKVIIPRPCLLETIIDEEQRGIDVKRKYGENLIDLLLAQELVRRANSGDVEDN